MVKSIVININKHPRAGSHLDEEFLIFENINSNESAIYLKVRGEDEQGFNRQYFMRKELYGFKAFSAQSLCVIESWHGAVARHRFDTKVVEDGWLSANKITQ